MKIQVGSYSAQGDRAENEDAVAVEQTAEEMAYAVVADGLGGHGGGKAASGTAIRHFRRCRAQTSLPTKEEIARWFEGANQEILEKRDDPNHMKTTVVFLAVQGDQAIWAHIGDSRLYHFYLGELADVTLDHSMCQMEVEVGEITRDQIPNHPNRSCLLRALGEEDYEAEYHDPIQLQPGRHGFLLCSDGLWERLVEEEIGLDLQKSATPKDWLNYLRRRAENRKWKGVDNNTAAVIITEI